ncbi:MFS transporter [Nonomuraea salmonea]|uniref:MFS transporter n=1 Tax=Nonomuraea salmonea TaxID=46181 RepID=A0ABV5NE01_9ACTN
MTQTLAPPIRIGRPAMAALGTLAVATSVLESVMAPALPLLQRELDVSPAVAALLPITTLIAGALVTPVAGKLGDRYGAKLVLMRLMAVVAAGGLVSALAPNLPVLLVGQVLQGAMMGVLPLSFILVRKYLPPGDAQVAIGLVTGLFIGGGMVGTLIAGPLAEGLSRHAMFGLPTLVIVAATVTVARVMPRDPAGRPGAGVDWPGLALLSGTMLSLMAGLAILPEIGARPVVIVAVVIVTIGFGTAFVLVERRAAAPMVDLAMLTAPGMWTSCVMTLVVCVGSASATYLVPQLFGVSGDGYGFGISATATGLLLLPSLITSAASGPIAGFAVRRYGSRPVAVAGIAVMAATLLVLAAAHAELWQLVVGKAVIALAAGLCVTAMLTGTTGAVAQADTGIATGLVLVARVVGSALGIQASAVLLTAGTDPVSGVPGESGFVLGFVLAGVVTATSLLVHTFRRKEVQA